MDPKEIGLKALDVVVGLGAAVAGGYGGPEAAKGVMMAGGAIKDVTNEATGEGSRADRHDRADFQARDAALAKQQEAKILAADDRATGRAELMKLGWSAEKADLILNGPQSGVTVASLTAPPNATGQPPPAAAPQQRLQLAANTQTTAPEEQSTGIGGVIGKLLKGATATKVQEQPGTIVSGATGTNDADAYAGTQTISSIGTLIKGAMAQKA